MVAADTQNCSKPRAIKIGRYIFERGNSCIYLRSLVTGDNKISEEITNHLITTNRSYFWPCHRNLDYDKKWWKKTDYLQSENPNDLMCKRGQWQKRYNKQLEELIYQYSFVIKSGKLRWVVHVVQMDENELPKMILWTNSGARWGNGRPNLR